MNDAMRQATTCAIGVLLCAVAIPVHATTITGSGRDFKEPGFGGGIYAVGTVTISNSTLSDNLVLNYGNGGCIWNGETVEIGNTILNGGQPDNIFSSFGTVTSNGYNLSSDNGGGYLNGPGDQINTDPLLGPLPGQRRTDSYLRPVARKSGNRCGRPNFTPPPWYDQRGPDFWRLRNGHIDIRSFEVQLGAKVTPTPTPTPRSSPTPRSRPTPPR
jgi:hypothetical protein